LGWLSLPVPFLLGAFSLLWFILCRDLSLEWSSNEQYSYGWFVPFFAAFLFWLRWEDFSGIGGTIRPRRMSSTPQKQGRDGARPSSRLIRQRTDSPQGTSVLCLLFSVFLLLLLFPVRLFEVANPDWRPLSWTHALVVVSLTLLAIFYRGGIRALRHFAFPVCFILVAVPWLTPIEGPIVQGLMRLVAAVATEALTLFGIPAQLEGSLIRVHNGVVGVSEACSGVRSLQTSLMIGLLFGELKRLTIAQRIILVAVALTIALVANFGRAFFLVWIAATRSLAAVKRWHDIAGYAIVGVVFVGTIAIASALSRLEGRAPSRPLVKVRGQNGATGMSDIDGEAARVAVSEWDTSASKQKSEVSGARSSLRSKNSFSVSVFSVSAFAYLLFVEVAVSGWYRWHESKLVPARQWTAQWPETAPGFRELPIDGHTREMLKYDHGRQVSWVYAPIETSAAPNEGQASPAERSGRAFLFFFRWEPGTATVLRARAHRPDICLPAVGWKPVGEPQLRSYPVADDFALPFQHFSVFLFA
jgi:exosortase